MPRYDPAELVANVERALRSAPGATPASHARQPAIEPRVWDAGLRRMGELQDVASVPAGTRFGFFKRLLGRILRLVSAPQSTFNAGAVQAILELTRAVDALQSRVDEQDQRIAELLSAQEKDARQLTDMGEALLNLEQAHFAERERLAGEFRDLVSRVDSRFEELHQRIGLDMTAARKAFDETRDQFADRVSAVEARFEENEAESLARLEETLARTVREAQQVREDLSTLFKGLESALGNDRATLHRRIDDTAATLGQEQGRQNAQVQLVTAALQEVERLTALHEATLLRVEARTQALQARIAAPPAGEREERPTHDDDDGGLIADDIAYEEFQRIFRGSEDDLRNLSRESAALISREVGAAAAGSLLVDLGCGDGVFLDEARDAGFRVFGVDSNGAAVETARARGLDAVRHDAIEWLRVQPAESCRVITAFQVLEHLPDAALRAFFAEALRVLEPGGLLVAETINPRTLYSLRWYLLDPTHRRFLDPELLRFVAEQAGFTSVTWRGIHPVEETARLRPGAGLDDESTAKLNDLLFGPQDYLLLARRPAPEHLPPDSAAGEIHSATQEGTAP